MKTIKLIPPLLVLLISCGRTDVINTVKIKRKRAVVSAAIGAINPRQYSVNFNVDEYKRSVFKIHMRKANTSSTTFLVNDKGYLLTNYHAISMHSSFNESIDGTDGFARDIYKNYGEIVDESNERYSFDLIAYPPKEIASIEGSREKLNNALDVAVIKISKKDLARFLSKKYKALSKWSYRVLEKGEDLFAIAYSSVHYSDEFITNSLIENGIKINNTKDQKEAVYLAGKFTDYYKSGNYYSNATKNQICHKATYFDTDAIDATIGSSGAPVVDRDGNLVGLIIGTNGKFNKKATTTVMLNIDRVPADLWDHVHN